MRRRRWLDRAATWGATSLVASVALLLGAPLLRALAFGALGAVVAAAVLAYGGRAVRWYREHNVTVAVWLLVSVHGAIAVAAVWLRWGP